MNSNYFILRKINNQYILVPYKIKLDIDYIILNFISATIYKFYFIENLSVNEVVFKLKNIYPDIDINILKNDVKETISNIFKIINKKTIKNTNYNENTIFQEVLNNNKIISSIMFELTYDCNLKCLHCYCTHCNFNKNELSKNEIFNILDQIVEKGCLWIVFTGGEVLLRKDFKEIYIYSKKIGLIITIFSNALLINDDLIDIFINFPPKTLEISVYGASNETYFKLTKDKKGFDKLVKSLNLLDYNEIKYSIKTFITHQNKNDFYKIKELALNRDIPFRFDSKIINSLDGMIISDSIALNSLEVLEFENKEYNDENNILQINNNKNKFIDNKLFYCSAGSTSCLINPFGEVTLCSRIRSINYNIKNYSFDNIKELLNKKSDIKISNNFNCKLCDAFIYCNVCPSVAFMDNYQKQKEFCNFAHMKKIQNEQELIFK